MNDDQRPAKKIKYEKPLLIDLVDRDALGSCNHGSGPGPNQQCGSGGAASKNPCVGGGNPQGCKPGIAAIGGCLSGTGG